MPIESQQTEQVSQGTDIVSLWSAVRSLEHLMSRHRHLGYDFSSVIPTDAVVVTLVDESTPALNASEGTVFFLTATGNRTIAIPSNPVSGQRIIIVHKASGGARTLALNSGAGGFRFGTDITGLTATTSGKTDYLCCIYNQIDSYWDVVSVVKGY